jgi:3-oxoacyl-[acyl-carrier protein] reductase
LIVVTGASKGLGRSIREHLKKKNENVIGLSRTFDNSDSNLLKCDVSNYESVLNVLKQIKKMKKPLKAFINAAGIASMNLAVTTDKNTVQKIIQTNLIGTIYCCQLFAPLMIRKKKGCFINFSTIAVALALKGESVYAASKAGVETFSKTFAREVSDFNIQVNCIAPGPINTDLLKGISSDQIKNILLQQIIRKQFEKSDVCNLIDLLLDDKASSISGQVLHIGGV